MGFAEYVKNLTDNDEWYTPRGAVEVILPYIPKNYVVWCPFDKASSQYVQVLSGGGIKVIHSHSELGQDFFHYEPCEHYDCIVSNPPYSKKDAVYERLFRLGKPWAMFMGMNGLFDSKKRFGMFREHGVQLLIPNGRTKFVSSSGKDFFAPPFQAVYVCWNILPETIMFEQEENGLFDEVAE